jgi:hypothetical protein
MKPLFRPRLPEEARKKLHSGGSHKNKKAWDRKKNKQFLQRQMKDFSSNLPSFQSFCVNEISERKQWCFHVH